MPCSMLEHEKDLEDVLAEKQHLLLEGSQQLVLDALRTRFRSLVAKHCGKKYMLKLMPTNESIPMCAIQGTLRIAQEELGMGCDESVNDTPNTRDAKLNAMDNQRELELCMLGSI